MSSLPCETCGCTEYTCREGFFICNNCDTLSQEIQDQRFEFVDFGRNADDEVEREEVTSEKSVAERKLTSWECYNIVLHGLVDELIDLGASKKIKVFAFQLWSSYLQWAKVAFISKDEEKLPALSLGFRNKDVDSLYGVSNLRKKLFKNTSRRKYVYKRKRTDSDLESISVSSSRNLKFKQRKLAMDEMLSESEYSTSDVQTLASLEKERLNQLSRKRNIVFRSSARKALKDIIDLADEPEDLAAHKKQAKKHKSKLFRLVFDRRYKSSGQKAPNVPITTVTLITILRLALHLANDEIFLGDILRWICEGRLSVNQPEKFVPSFYLYAKKNDLLNVHRRGFQLDIRNFTSNLNLADLPPPNLFKLVERYCCELYVPSEFIQLVLRLMSDSKVEMDYANYQFRIFPDYECRVMAFILFAFKLLFSLDDFTECRLSAFADAINKIQESQPTKGVSKLFSWNMWMRHIECRKAVLSQYYAPVCEMTYSGRFCEDNVFLNHWEKVKPTFETTGKAINEALLSSLSKEIRSLSFHNLENSDEVLMPDSPVSMTPYRSQIEYLLKNHLERLSLRSRELLSENFRSYSIKYAFDSEWCYDIAEKFGLNVESSSPAEHPNLEVFERANYSVVGSNSKALHRCDFRVDVLVEDNIPAEMRNIQVETVPFKASIFKNDLESDRVYHQSSCLRMHHPASYWCFHECAKSISVEEFGTLAQNNFPRSFLWLLRECASMLRTDEKELYLELIFVEIVLHRLYGQPLKKRSSLKVNMKEW